METIILNYDASDPFAKKMIEALLVSGAFSLERKKKKSELRKSIEEAREGHYFVAKDAKEALAKCLE